MSAWAQHAEKRLTGLSALQSLLPFKTKLELALHKALGLCRSQNGVKTATQCAQVARSKKGRKAVQTTQI